jgi:hypothetical protein
MTSKQIEKLNVKIARKLGWKDLKKENLPVPLQSEKRTIGIAPGNERHQYVPNYFGNLAYALKIIDWANEHGYDFKLFRFSPSNIYSSKFNNLKKGNFISSEGTIPSVAICLAFLKIK